MVRTDDAGKVYAAVYASKGRSLMPRWVHTAEQPRAEETWRERLRGAVRHSGRKHSDIAYGAGISAVTLSRILNGPNVQPAFLTIVHLAHELGVTVGWLLDERDFQVDQRQRSILRAAVDVLSAVL